MGRLIVLVLLGSGIWMALWAFGSIAYERELRNWLADRQALGWDAEIEELVVEGFPNRFDTTVSGLRLADPGSGYAWSAPFVQTLSLAYKPHQVIAVLPPRHEFSTPGQTVSIAHDQARASVFLDASTSLPLERVVIIIDRLSLASSLGWDMAVTEGRFAVEHEAATEASYRVGAALSEVVPPEFLSALLDPGGRMPADVEALGLDASVRLDAPLDRHALDGPPPQVAEVNLADLSLKWGGVALRANGELELDSTGALVGNLDVQATQWRQVLDMASAAGLLGQEVPSALVQALELASLKDGRPETLNVPMVFKNGTTSLGPIPIGPAPKILFR